MSYSRWSGSRWYTFWACQDGRETRDSALFEICTVATFTAAELRDDIEACVSKAKEKEAASTLCPVTDNECAELRGYMEEFLAEVAEHFVSGDA